ncbi:hypothetical protein BBP40_006085 [Aspergillus hancockii]|nr:hypothetical protein BBP40_006085 [Aspergillus hancockii]
MSVQQSTAELLGHGQPDFGPTSLPLSLDSGSGRDSPLPALLLSTEGSNDQPIPSLLLDNLETQQSGNVFPPPSQQSLTNVQVPSATFGWDTGISSCAGNRLPAPHPGLPRRRSRYLMRCSERGTGPIVIPSASALNPMERWRESPPEDEPASMAAILDALKQTPLQQRRRPGRGNNHDPIHNANAFRHYRRTASPTSGESSGSSRASQHSARSRSSTQDPMGVQPRRGRVRAGKSAQRDRDVTDKQRRYCCTFCCDRFKSKYDWARHEKSIHLNLEAWYCAPFGTTVVSPMTQRNHCAFCNAVDPDSQHLDQHDHKVCESGSGARRSFHRKDHLVQHLRLVHNVDAPPRLDDWKIGQSAITSRCGFCDQGLSTWGQRVEHLAEHFRKDATMNEWREEHEFPPEFAAQVINALPPYLIGTESQSLIPFSATNSDARDHFAQISSRARWGSVNKIDRSPPRSSRVSSSASLQVLAPGISAAHLSSFTQVLTLHLSRYAQEQIKQGIIPTDEMFQQESRRLLYDSEDSWNQTIADNPERLSAFRGLYCDKNTGSIQGGQQLTYLARGLQM